MYGYLENLTVTGDKYNLEQRDRWEVELIELIARPDEPIAIQRLIGMPMLTASKPVRARDASGHTED